MSKECKRNVNKLKKWRISRFFVGMVEKRRRAYFFGIFTIVLLLLLTSSDTIDSEENSERVRVALRSIGNQLLLADGDSTSLVLPITVAADNQFKISFEKKLSILPDSLTTLIANELERYHLPEEYRVEVFRCNSKLVAYGYEVTKETDENALTCKLRILPKDCYYITIRFLSVSSSIKLEQLFLYALLIISIALIVFSYRKRKISNEVSLKAFKTVGRFQFYEEENKLILATEEIPLSKKEVELLQIFIAHLNQVVKREDLIKQVWEDKGVIVGRSLDTYISKLRKKLSADESIQLNNVHGVGYKLEIKN